MVGNSELIEKRDKGTAGREQPTLRQFYHSFGSAHRTFYAAKVVSAPLQSGPHGPNKSTKIIVGLQAVFDHAQRSGGVNKIDSLVVGYRY